MFTSNDPKDTEIKIRLPMWLKDKLKEYCLKHNIEMSEFIRKLIKENI